MKIAHRLAPALVAAAMLAAPLQAAADSLYPVAASQVGAPHPLRLVNDRRAGGVGDLVAVQFDFSVSSTSTAAKSTKKNYNVALVGGTGLFNLPLIRVPGAISGATSSGLNNAASDASSFSTVMMATVTDVLPSGALAIEGDQQVIVDGQHRKLHVTGVVRREDIDQSDTVLSSRIANVSANFDGDNKSDHHGLLQKVLDVLF